MARRYRVHLFLAYTPEQLSAFAAFCSAVAALALGIIGFLTWRATKRMSDATVEYVKATKEIVAITHNPVLGIDVQRVGVGKQERQDEKVTVTYNLLNLGNAPALFINSVVRIEAPFGTLYSTPPPHVISHIGISREESAVSVLDEASTRLLGYMQNAAFEFFESRPYTRSKHSELFSSFVSNHSPRMIVTALYQNHVGQFYKSELLTDLLPEPWNGTTIRDITSGRHTIGVAFWFHELKTEEEYNAEMKRMILQH